MGRGSCPKRGTHLQAERHDCMRPKSNAFRDRSLDHLTISVLLYRFATSLGVSPGCVVVTVRVALRCCVK
jgi:hypothetical protein